MLSYIISQVCDKLGYDPVNDRVFLLKVINAACKEVYESTDLPGSLREITVLALADNTIALPHYVGELRGMRGKYALEKIELREMAQRYSYNNWPQLWNNWRVLKKSPVKTSLTNVVYPLVLTLGEVLSETLVVTVTGQTPTADKLVEEVTFAPGDLTQIVQAEFVDIFSLTKDIVTTSNISLTESATGTELANFPNDKLNCIYTIVDVSLLPYGGNNNGPYRYVDVLFKSPLPALVEDGEEFICVGYDDVIVAKVCEHYYSKVEGGGQKAVEFGIKAAMLQDSIIEHTNGATQKDVVFAPNQYLGYYPRWRFNPNGRRYLNYPLNS